MSDADAEGDDAGENGGDENGADMTDDGVRVNSEGDAGAADGNGLLMF